MSFCVNCGNKLPDNALYCGQCGTRIDCAKSGNPVSTKVPARIGPTPGVKSAGSRTNKLQSMMEDWGDECGQDKFKVIFIALIVIAVVVLLFVLMLWDAENVNRLCR